MKLRALRCALVAAAFLMLATASLEADAATGSGWLKSGASGQVYAWQAGTC